MGPDHRDGLQSFLQVLSSLGLIFFTGAALAFIAHDGVDRSAPELDRLLTTGSVAVGMVAVVVLMNRARRGDRVRYQLLAAALLGMCTVTWAVAELSPLIDGNANPEGFARLRDISLVGVFLLFIAALSSTDTGKLDYRAAVLPGLATGLLVAAIAFTGDSTAGIAVAIVWASLFAGYATRYLRTGDQSVRWVAVAIFGFMLADIGRAAVVGAEAGWVLATGAERLLGSLLIVIGFLAVMDREEKQKAAALAQSTKRLKDLEAIGREAREKIEERDHQARSALGAIEFSTQALKRFGGSMDASAFAEMELAISSELELLRRLVTLPDPIEPLQRFDLEAAIAGVVAAKRAAGMDIQVLIAEDMMVIGTPAATAEIVQILLDNAERHAFSSPVEIRASSCYPWVILQVDDVGPGVPEERRKTIFKRGRDGGLPTSASGRGLGLYLADRLAHEQRAHLWVETADAGGASFRLALRAGTGKGSTTGSQGWSRRSKVNLALYSTGGDRR